MTRDKANEWIENTFSGYTKEEDRQESIFYLVKRIYDSFEKKNTFDVNIKLTDLCQFKDFTNVLKENIDSLPTELKDKLSEILEK
ncbi:hypothetical protein [Cetobacterium sp.]|uniref:hypothetical protein n=1 Tax=Cetobacterium sp. TaxID=2071632 RepID=UPI003F3D6F29